MPISSRRPARLSIALALGALCGCATARPASPFPASATADVSSSPIALWNDVKAGATPDSVRGLVFEDARHVVHRLSRHFEMGAFYVRKNEPVIVRVLFAGKPKRVIGVDIQGTKSSEERMALLTQWGPPGSRTFEDILASPGGSAMLNDGGKRFEIWRWRKEQLVITFADRIRPGYFVTSYRRG